MAAKTIAWVLVAIIVAVLLGHRSRADEYVVVTELASGPVRAVLDIPGAYFPLIIPEEPTKVARVQAAYPSMEPWIRRNKSRSDLTQISMLLQPSGLSTDWFIQRVFSKDGIYKEDVSQLPGLSAYTFQFSDNIVQEFFIDEDLNAPVVIECLRLPNSRCRRHYKYSASLLVEYSFPRSERENWRQFHTAVVELVDGWVRPSSEGDR